MVKVDYDDVFKRVFSKIKDKLLRIKIEKQIQKIIQNPEVGKPMQHNRKGTREVYTKPFRLSYSYNQNEDVLTFLDFYHKDEQ